MANEPAPQLEVDMVVADLLTQWPQTATVFNQFQTACVGCTFSHFCTLAYVADEYQLDVDQLIADLEKIIKADGGGTQIGRSGAE
ncbi:MAG TPA: DUF1858 domain-containing protein [Anaerolineae bacterium]|nr:DUF1858 domain-containing protein [Anaerolineae bacterium]